jgi:hypothetical protein
MKLTAEKLDHLNSMFSKLHSTTGTSYLYGPEQLLLKFVLSNGFQDSSQSQAYQEVNGVLA